MPLTPVDIHNMEFTKASLGKRGYDEEGVNALLDEAGQEMIRLLEENDLLQRGVERGDDRLAETTVLSAETTELSAAAIELDRARHACDLAVRNAHQVQRQLDEARHDQERRHESRQHVTEIPDGVMSLARRTADDHLHRAGEESQALIADARQRSERMTREAFTLARDIERDADRHRDETIAAVRTGREGLLRQIDELSRFAADYRKALSENMLRQVDRITGSASAG
jgi:DivIVA domain-containing protein